MIARIVVLLLLLILIPDAYLYRRYLRRRWQHAGWKTALWWMGSMGMVAYTLWQASLPGFVPVNHTWIYLYLLLLGLWVVPKAVYALCSAIGLGVCRLRHSRRNWGNLVGLLLAIGVAYVVAYGVTVGLRKLEVRHVDLYFPTLPPAFDGYRIVHFSDAHVGTFTGPLRKVLQRDIDSINAQHPDAIVFTGDLQNMYPSELYPVEDMLRSLHATDGVFSVLGNHDYSTYSAADPAVKAANEREIVNRELQYGWNLLLNANTAVKRGDDVIVIAGEENGGAKPAAPRDSLQKTLEGADSTAFVIMLQHDPSVWERDILPHSNVPLTLSGHTHGGQLALFGIRATELVNPYDYGLYEKEGRYMYVTSGIGGLLPFRFGISPEIVVLTLHRK